MALSTAQEIIEIADKFAECADSMQERTLMALNNDEIARDQASALFQDQLLFRTHINKMYIQSGNLVVEGVQAAQSELSGVVDQAKDKLKRVNQIAKYVDLVSDVIVFASSIYARKPDLIISSFNEVKNDLDNID
ncbi:hypothetical protein [Agarilytica rhodophyticola]|uniref:hypothetical protein n=1 Tax=Agarilytica rhodophyticola TaxID=1737490 RepID=UPI000B343F63|nr:hypothetical protein [Agarilytica rhodophyticola]